LPPDWNIPLNILFSEPPVKALSKIYYVIVLVVDEKSALSSRKSLVFEANRYTDFAEALPIPRHISPDPAQEANVVPDARGYKLPFSVTLRTKKSTGVISLSPQAHTISVEPELYKVI
jgi:hypothetical protein